MERVAFLIEDTGERIDCLVNPESVVLRREAGLHRRRLVGEIIGDSAWSDDALICGGGLTELQLDLLFDTSLVAPPNKCADVQELTAPFWALAEHAVDAGGYSRPHVARFLWSKEWNVPGVVAAVAERFECFLPNGAPQRSWLRMLFVRVDDGARAQGDRPTQTQRVGPAPGPSFPVTTPDPLDDGMRADWLDAARDWDPRDWLNDTGASQALPSLPHAGIALDDER
ncbi:hypothetical protein [Caballeronia sp. ATUFL_M2_KS44]|uniref:CIS tube protein n=1 Tax=Caballeronia sp. ATUFL_M2_KS44 TaxID=2921767 RepID=UPI00202796BF|nr:hypothetical protein [Caballeronia sp. ATUFL_M2_KS44]